MAPDSTANLTHYSIVHLNVTTENRVEQLETRNKELLKRLDDLDSAGFVKCCRVCFQETERTLRRSVPGRKRHVLWLELLIERGLDPAVPRQHRLQTRWLHLPVACWMQGQEVGLSQVPFLPGHFNAGQCVHRPDRPVDGSPNVVLLSHSFAFPAGLTLRLEAQI